MSEATIHVRGGVVDVVFSPDDGGYYLEHFNIKKEHSRVSKRIYATRAEAERALRLGTVKWER